MSARRPRASLGRTRIATYEKPHCYERWAAWDSWYPEECTRCHLVFEGDDFMVYHTGGWDKDFPRVCDDCLVLTLIGMGREKPWFGPGPKDRLMIVDGPIERTERYVHVLKPSDASFYVCQTTDLPIRSRLMVPSLQ